MVSLTGPDGEFIDFFDSEGEALVYAAMHSLSDFRIDSPFR